MEEAITVLAQKTYVSFSRYEADRASDDAIPTTLTHGPRLVGLEKATNDILVHAKGRGLRRSIVAKRLAIISSVAVAVLTSPLTFAQPQKAEAKEATAPAGVPRHDISGTWTPAIAGSGIGGPGPFSAPSDGKHEPPYTAAAREKMKPYPAGKWDLSESSSADQ